MSGTFTNGLPKEQVVRAVNSALVGDGSIRHDESFGPGQGVVAEWTKRLATGTPAEVSVYPVPAGTTNWILTATSKPPGFALPGCLDCRYVPVRGDTFPMAKGGVCSAPLAVGRGGLVSRPPVGAIRVVSLGPSCADTPRSFGACWR